MGMLIIYSEWDKNATTRKANNLTVKPTIIYSEVTMSKALFHKGVMKILKIKLKM
jgi:hypothetical protein